MTTSQYSPEYRIAIGNVDNQHTEHWEAVLVDIRSGWLILHDARLEMGPPSEIRPRLVIPSHAIRWVTIHPIEAGS